MSIEESIASLVAALDRNTAALGGAVAEDPVKRRGRKPATPEQSQPPASLAPVAASAPAATQPAQSAVVTPTPVVVNTQLLQQATNAVITLANEHSRDAAVGILGKKRGAAGERAGVTRCSDLNPADYQDVLDEAAAAIAAAEAAKKQAASTNSLV